MSALPSLSLSPGSPYSSGGGRNKGARRPAGHTVPVRVVSLLDDTEGRCCHLICCEQTWTAAVVDPLPELAGEIAAIIAARGLRLRLVLRTGVAGPQAESSRRYRSLISDLGLDAAPAGGGPARDATTLPWAGLPEVAPLGRTSADGLIEVQAGPVRVRLALDGQGGPLVTVGGAAPRPPVGARVRGLRAALGAFHVRAVALGSGQGLAWTVADRVFSGTCLRGGSHGGTPDVLLQLPVETLVYPSLMSRGRTISTVGEERRITAATPTPATGRKLPVRHLRTASQPTRHLRVHADASGHEEP